MDYGLCLLRINSFEILILQGILDSKKGIGGILYIYLKKVLLLCNISKMGC